MGGKRRAGSAGNELDLRGMPCPLSWAKAKVRLETLGSGEQLTVWELVRPDRFGWPAVFTCRRHRGDTTPASVFANDPDEMNERLLAAGIWPEDCHGGFSIRSTPPHPGKLDDIEGNVLEHNRGPRAEYTDKATFEASGLKK